MLILPIKKTYFDDIRIGIKTTEFRKNNKYYQSRIRDSHGVVKHDTVKLINGYGSHRPFMIIELLDVVETPNIFKLQLGKILKKGNLKLKEI